VGDVKIPLTPIVRSSRQNLKKETSEFNNTIDQMEVTDFYRIFHQTGIEYTFFSAAHGTVSKRDHIFYHKASLNKCKKIEIISYILPDNNEIKLEINNKKNFRKHPNTWRLNNSLLNDQWVIK
jgi:hypothetical protein